MSHPKWPSWRYGPKGEAAVFEAEADVPNGWHDHPSKHAKSPEPAAAKTAPAKSAKKPGRKPKAKPAPLDL